MIKVEGINVVVWQYAKSNFKYDTYEELLSQLRTKFNEWLEQDYEISELEIVQLVYETYCDYIQHGIPVHLNRNFFKTLIGDNVIEAVYGKDTRNVNHRVIEGIITVLRNSQVYDNGVCLINYGQEKL